MKFKVTIQTTIDTKDYTDVNENNVLALAQGMVEGVEDWPKQVTIKVTNRKIDQRTRIMNRK